MDCKRVTIIPNRQRGVVLPVVLVVLLLLGYSGLGALKASRLSTYMSVGYKDFQVAFYNSETVVGDVERGLLERLGCELGGGEDCSEFGWVVVGSPGNEDFVSLPDSHALHEAGSFHIGFLGENMADDPIRFRIYQITAKAGNGFGSANTVLQSVVKICTIYTAPDTSLCDPDPMQRISWTKIQQED